MAATLRAQQHVSEIIPFVASKEATNASANAQASRANKHVDTILEAMPNAIITLDSSGFINHANRAARQLLNVRLEQRLWRDVIQQVFAPRADDGHEVSLRNGRRVRLDISSLSPESPEPGQLIVLTDLTETRALQARVGQMQRLSAMGRMVAALAHQVRTPLSAAMLYADNLKDPRLVESQRLPFLNKLSARLSTLEHQVNDMLLFAKSGEQQVLQSFTVVELTQQLEQQTEAYLQQQSAELKIVLNGAVSQSILRGNLNALVGAFQNLVMNGIQASADQAVIVVTVTAKNDGIEVTVQDSGSGIEPEKLEQIFTPFMTTKTHGTGLGLAVVQSVIKAHQGAIQVQSKLAQGTTFSVWLPQLETQTTDTPKESSHV